MAPDNASCKKCRSGLCGSCFRGASFYTLALRNTYPTLEFQPLHPQPTSPASGAADKPSTSCKDVEARVDANTNRDLKSNVARRCVHLLITWQTYKFWEDACSLNTCIDSNHTDMCAPNWRADSCVCCSRWHSEQTQRFQCIFARLQASTRSLHMKRVGFGARQCVQTLR